MNVYVGDMVVFIGLLCMSEHSAINVCEFNPLHHLLAAGSDKVC